MKTIKFLLIALLFIGCNVQKKVQKSETTISQNEEIISTYKKKIDSLSEKLTQVRSEKQKEVTKIEWKYTAPTIDTLFIKEKVPVWLMIAGDSVNVSSLPSGSSLSYGNSTEKTIEFYEIVIKELTKKLEEAQGKVITNTNIEYVDREVIREVEKSAYNWYLLAVIFALGMFTPEIFKFVMKKINPIN